MKMMENHNYIVEPTGADDLAQNEGTQSWNGMFLVTVRALLYGKALSTVHCSASLIHIMFLHNIRVHSRTGMTPHKAWYGVKPVLKQF